MLQKLDAILHFVSAVDCMHERQPVHPFADVVQILLAKYDSGMFSARGSKMQEISVICAENSPLFRGILQVVAIIDTEQTQVTNRDGIDIAQAKLTCDLNRHVFIKIEAKACHLSVRPWRAARRESADECLHRVPACVDSSTRARHTPAPM